MKARLVELVSGHAADPDLPFAGEAKSGIGSERHVTPTRDELTVPLE